MSRVHFFCLVFYNFILSSSFSHLLSEQGAPNTQKLIVNEDPDRH